LLIHHLPFVTKGKLTDVLFNGSVYKDDQGNVLGRCCRRDIKKIIERTDRKLVRTRNRNCEEKTKCWKCRLIAENAVKAKQQFLSNMSHEIRTPWMLLVHKGGTKTDLTSKQKNI
jgi:hypothetical protein